MRSIRPFASWVRACLLGFMLLLPCLGRAQSGSVRTEVDAHKIGVDDTLTLSIILEGEAANLDVSIPQLKNLKVVGAPSTSTQMSFVNGSVSRQKIFSFPLRPEKVGPAEIGSVTAAGHPPTSPIAIEVVAGAIRPVQAQQDPFGRDPFGGRDPFEEIFGRAQRRQPVNQGKLLVEAVLSRNEAHVGEPILVTYYVYTQVSLSGVEFADAPKYPGFWAEEIERSRNESTGENVLVQGEPFLRYPVLERLLFPTKPGQLDIPEARLRLVPAGGSFGVSAPIERSTKILRVKVDSLPTGTPEGSPVGTYEVQATADRTTISLGDALTFRFRVRGRGNLKWIDAAPALDLPGVRVFPPRVTSDLKATRQGIEGSKTWEFVVVPEKVGSYEIPSIPFSYFNPETQALRTEHTAPIPVVVSPASGSAQADAGKGVPPGVSLRGDLDVPHKALSAVAMGLAGLSLLAQIYLWRRRSDSISKSRTNEADITAALRELKSTDLLSGAKERSAGRIAAALELAFGLRNSWPSNDLGDRLRGLSDDLEFLRFAPQLGSYDAKLREVRDRAIALMERAR